MFRPLSQTLKMVRLRDFRVARESCGVCGLGLLVQLRDNEIGVRCPRCGASAITLSIVAIIRRLCPQLATMDVYEMSAQGPLVRWLLRNAATLATSEYFEAVAKGAQHRGTVCQDVQHLTYPDNNFDLCTSTEVFEHVEDDMAGFAEVLRVLRPGGWFSFTVPISSAGTTVERTALRNGERVSVLPDEYHSDRYRGHHVFCFRNYGLDIVDRLRNAGFASADLYQPEQTLFGHARPVIAAQKPT